MTGRGERINIVARAWWCCFLSFTSVVCEDCTPRSVGVAAATSNIPFVVGSVVDVLHADHFRY
jgi:hypothetical protein